MAYFTLFFALICLISLVVAAPVVQRSGERVVGLSSSEVSSYTPYTWYANAGYCSATATLAWNCGPSCNANAVFKPVASGGDGVDVQFWFVGYDPSLDTVIVSHQGTRVEAILPLLTDSDILLQRLDSSLFPRLSSSLQVHSGFASEHAKTATTVLAAVQKTMSMYGASKVTTLGHSLGGAIALLDSIYLPLHIYGATFAFIGYGLPRVGNQAFASYVDAQPISVAHVNNEQDLVPILPGEFLGYVHPSGEVHIQNSGEWASCSGQDNPSSQCIVGDVPTILEGDEADHDGPYNGVTMDSACSG